MKHKALTKLAGLLIGLITTTTALADPWISLRTDTRPAYLGEAKIISTTAQVTDIAFAPAGANYQVGNYLDNNYHVFATTAAPWLTIVGDIWMEQGHDNMWTHEYYQFPLPIHQSYRAMLWKFTQSFYPPYTVNYILVEASTVECYLGFTGSGQPYLIPR